MKKQSNHKHPMEVQNRKKKNDKTVKHIVII